MFNVKQFGIASTLALALCGTANATSVTYDYVGNNFDYFYSYDAVNGNSNSSLPTSVGPRLTGSATFADGIENAVSNYFLTDGINTVDKADANYYNYFDMTFTDGNVNTWDIIVGNLRDLNNNAYAVDYMSSISNNGYNVDFSQNYGYADQINANTYYQYQANNYNTPGTWTLRQDEVSAVPVPAALPLMASALGLFGFVRRKYNA